MDAVNGKTSTGPSNLDVIARSRPKGGDVAISSSGYAGTIDTGDSHGLRPRNDMEVGQLGAFEWLRR